MKRIVFAIVMIFSLSTFASINFSIDKSANSYSTEKISNTTSSWKVLGWGKFGGKQMFLKDSRYFPKLLSSITKIENRLTQNPESNLAINALKLSKGKSKIEIEYNSKGRYLVIVDNDTFIVYGRKSKKEFKRVKGKKIVKQKMLKNGESISFTLNHADYGLEAGDELIYRATAKGLNPCVVLK